MIKDKKFFYKAQKVDNGEWIEGRVGTSQSVEDGIEKTTYSNEYIGDKCDNADWSVCVVITDTITPILQKIIPSECRNCESENCLLPDGSACDKNFNRCPNCGEVLDNDCSEQYKHCPDCGQALIW